MKWVVFALLLASIALLYRIVRTLLEILDTWRGKRQMTVRGRTVRAALADLLMMLIVFGCVLWTIWFILTKFLVF
ncbi:MAG TPA: hypothetical protein PLN71_18220 [Anaerolineae bacterium]|nr:hypothetical protein [Anaerolineae bacterium]